ncbi:hypothetical protein CXU14_06315 [Akkermansia muciniphila]|nr:hypothetical protein CXU16_01220 [Akkermansia muciniphila]PNC44618.1 hypothetical protein CXU14_06315 [Akkermansia muciniphila]
MFPAAFLLFETSLLFFPKAILLKPFTFLLAFLLGFLMLSGSLFFTTFLLPLTILLFLCLLSLTLFLLPSLLFRVVVFPALVHFLSIFHALLPGFLLHGFGTIQFHLGFMFLLFGLFHLIIQFFKLFLMFFEAFVEGTSIIRKIILMCIAFRFDIFAFFFAFT